MIDTDTDPKAKEAEGKPTETESATGKKESTDSGTRMSKPELIKKLEELVRKYSDHTKKDRDILIRDELNSEKILSLHGKRWQTHSVLHFIKTNLTNKPSSKDKPEKTPSEKKPKLKKVVEPPPTVEPIHKTLLLDDHYPTFRNDLKRKGESIRLPLELVKLAKKKQETDAQRTGHTLPKLVELLLWHYLDRPEQFLWNHKGEKL